MDNNASQPGRDYREVAMYCAMNLANKAQALSDLSMRHRKELAAARAEVDAAFEHASTAWQHAFNGEGVPESFRSGDAAVEICDMEDCRPWQFVRVRQLPRLLSDLASGSEPASAETDGAA